MIRVLVNAASGSLFGAGLFLSGMTNPAKVQGFLDLSPAWDPTLAFVMASALLPMIVAWRWTRQRSPLTGGAFPPPPATQIDRKLVIGSVLFGVGWGLVGLCPGPAIASLSYQGTSGAIFVLAMLCGMELAPRLAMQLDRTAAKA